MAEFKYKRISIQGPAFRLLRLLRGNRDNIHCELYESELPPLQDGGGYEALSYTWGSESRPCEITINRKRTEVTKNAYLALRDLRHKDKDRIIWIDALCIDQNNQKERGEQVQQMRFIYSKAERVIIWLGEPAYDTDFAMHHMGKLQTQLAEDGMDNDCSSIETLDEHFEKAWSVVTNRLNKAKKNLLVEGVQSLLRRNWFKRVWIIQEAATADAADIACGGKFVSSTIFTRMPSLLAITPEPHCEPILQILPGPFRDRSWWAEKPDLYTMLVKFYKSDATDPRDNIYALLGISSDASEAENLKANYEEELENVIFNTTFFLLDINGSDRPASRFFNWTLLEFFWELK